MTPFSENPVWNLIHRQEPSATAISKICDDCEAQAFALADAHDGRLLTDDGDARSFAKDQGVTVIGSVGVLLAAIDAGRVSEETADDWLSTWVDEIGYYVPYRNITDYR